MVSQKRRFWISDLFTDHFLPVRLLFVVVASTLTDCKCSVPGASATLLIDSPEFSHGE